MMGRREGGREQFFYGFVSTMSYWARELIELAMTCA